MTELLSGVEAPSDAELIARVRGGEVSAYGELFSRHVDAARRLARQISRGSSDVDDLVSDAFAKTLQVLQAGGGPDVAFRAYLLTSLRRLHVDRIRATQRVQPAEDMTVFDDGVPFQDTAVAEFESGAAARAFKSLPERWQLVLWHLEVEKQKPADIAVLLGMTPNSVSALAYRAREGLRQAFLTMHLADVEGERCRWVNQHLGAYVRGGLSRRDSAKVEEHLDDCRRCAAMYLELTEVNSNLAGIIAPLFLGAAATGYLSSAGGATLTGFSGLVGRVRDSLGNAAGGSGTGGMIAVGTVAAAAVAAVVAAAVMLGGGPDDVVTEADRRVVVPSAPAELPVEEEEVGTPDAGRRESVRPPRTQREQPGPRAPGMVAPAAPATTGTAGVPLESAPAAADAPAPATPPAAAAEAPAEAPAAPPAEQRPPEAGPPPQAPPAERPPAERPPVDEPPPPEPRVEEPPPQEPPPAEPEPTVVFGEPVPGSKPTEWVVPVTVGGVADGSDVTFALENPDRAELLDASPPPDDKGVYDVPIHLEPGHSGETVTLIALLDGEEIDRASFPLGDPKGKKG